ncbi:MAG: F-type H+-transporting ATPase subunit delta [Candidatus Tokpelaia sp. JSC188]|nr:MAG: F-type H+-transporting ATPase subunit delta [Candidatus Tokpelaia sp. JSC188]
MSLVARRYAGSFFKLASKVGYLKIIDDELSVISRLLDASGDFKRFVRNPTFSVREQLQVIDVLIKKLNLYKTDASVLIGSFLRVVASNQRLFILLDIIEAFHDLVATAQGTVFADIISVHALDVDQQMQLKAVLIKLVGKNVILRVDVDPAILGGLIIRVGSCQIDTSLRAKLSSLKRVLKEVG